MSDLKIKSIKSLHYQRNGICGESFYQIVFTTNEAKGDFLAILPGKQSDFDGDVECYVTYLPDLTQCWRGDCLFDALKYYFGIPKNRKGLEDKWAVPVKGSVFFDATADFLKQVFGIETQKEAPDAAQA